MKNEIYLFKNSVANVNNDEIFNIPYEFNIFDKEQFDSFLAYAEILSLFYLNRKLDLDNVEQDLEELFDEIVKVNGKHPYYVYLGILYPISKILDKYDIITFEDILNNPNLEYYPEIISLALYNTLVDIYAKDPDDYYPIGSLKEITSTINDPKYQKDKVVITDDEANQYENDLLQKRIEEAKKNGFTDEDIQEYLNQ